MDTDPQPKTSRATSLWIGVALAFAALLGTWIALFVLAARHPIESVPIESRSH